MVGNIILVKLYEARGDNLFIIRRNGDNRDNGDRVTEKYERETMPIENLFVLCGCVSSQRKRARKQ